MSAPNKHNLVECNRATHIALLGYFSTRHLRDDMLMNVETDADFDAYEAADKKALLVVQKAFHHQTGSYNSMQKCMMLDAWEIARATGYDLTAHFPNAETPAERSAKIGSQRGFDIRRIEGWKK